MVSFDGRYEKMTRKTIITQAELKRFASLVTTEGVTIEIEREGTVIRIMPLQGTKAGRQPNTREQAAEEALAKWRISQSSKTMPNPKEEVTLPRGPNALQEWRAIMRKRLGVGPEERAKPPAIKRPKT
ncbi:hypothetical protein J2768_002467 [Agrobacterium tumefaciens]|uniref:hypothetical protein n=1 Tax=Agrobacterium tumefaciens TaxID=358 RepID=UPI001AEAD96D|nr:hypothetical protein [Agrobacterium tumefaciens]MBP2540030.1 hypothetical protein [Agrobacterium tumefaciens]